MLFADPQASSTAYLILRHLYDGDIIEWPIPDGHPHQPIFVGLEQQGYVARWDRVWPLRDRYRLTERGIAAIEQVYRPSGAEQFWNDLRARNLSPADRRAWLQQNRLDPVLWPLLHDPSTHWSTYSQQGSRYQSYLWEDQRPAKLTRAHRKAQLKQQAKQSGRIGGGRGGVRNIHHHHHHDPQPVHIVNLDRHHDHHEPLAPAGTDYDVS